jgi:hypothetical protein
VAVKKATKMPSPMGKARNAFFTAPFLFPFHANVIFCPWQNMI